jgi:hypothetical protein
MAYRPPVAVYDACVLYPFHLRNLLVQFGVDRLVEPRWTDEIHDEWIRSLIRRVLRQSVELLTLTRDLMNRMIPTEMSPTMRATSRGSSCPIWTIAVSLPLARKRRVDHRHLESARFPSGRATQNMGSAS